MSRDEINPEAFWLILRGVPRNPWLYSWKIALEVIWVRGRTWGLSDRVRDK